MAAHFRIGIEDHRADAIKVKEQCQQETDWTAANDSDRNVIDSVHHPDVEGMWRRSAIEDPTTRIGRCVRVRSGHAAALTPSSVMNTRLLMCSPQAEVNTLPQADYASQHFGPPDFRNESNPELTIRALMSALASSGNAVA
jgi:hypothetical protein